MGVDKFQRKLVKELRKSDVYEEASIYTVLLELCMGNDIDHIKEMLDEVVVDLSETKGGTYKAEASAQKLPNSKYVTADISDEATRTIIKKDMKYVIKDPVTLIFRKGGSTHRVVDKEGTVHCYAAPETGNSIIQWTVKQGKAPVRF